MASLELNAGALDEGMAHIERARALLPPSAGFGLALQQLAAYCAHDKAAPVQWRQGLAALELIGSDFYTINAMHWVRGALRQGLCGQSDRRALADALTRLAERAPAATNKERDTARRRAIVALSAALAKAGAE